MKTLFVGILAALTITAVYSVQAKSTASVYEVEVLVFKNLRPDLEGDELWLQETGENNLPEVEKAIVIGGAPSDKSQLSIAAEKLQDSGNYRIIAHKRWVQNAYTKSGSELIRINARGDTGSILDGTVLFYISRFLHLAVDLTLQDEAAALLSENIAPQLYRIKEERRIKTMDIHYFDHPKFGALVQIKPIR